MAVKRDQALKAWGELGIIAEVAKRTLCTYGRCRERRKRGHRVSLAPAKANMGSSPRPKADDLGALLASIDAVKVSGQVN